MRMRSNTSIRSTKKRSSMRNSIKASRSMEVVRSEDCILDMEEVTREVASIAMVIIIIIIGILREVGAGAVGLIRMVAIKGIST